MRLCLTCAQALNELTTSLGPFLEQHPAYRKALAVVQIPERIIQFRVVWEDDKGQTQVNRGYRVQVSTFYSNGRTARLIQFFLLVQLCLGSL